MLRPSGEENLCKSINVKQQQHRVPEVYLKEFGYLDGDQWMITTAEKHKAELMRGVGKRWVGAKSIGSVTTINNEFDLGNVLPQDTKRLEEFFWNFENRYLKVVEELNNQRLSDDTLGDLTDFIASVLIRSRRFRDMLAYYLEQPNARAFLNTMCMWMDPKEREERVSNIEAFNLPDRLNHTCYAVWHHLAKRLGSFHAVVLKDLDNSGWMTSDNPVVLRRFQARGGSLLGRDTELYFPITKDWCLFLHDPKCLFPMNPMRLLEDRSFVQAHEWVRYVIGEYIWENADELVFFSSRFKFSEPIESDSA